MATPAESGRSIERIADLKASDIRDIKNASGAKLNQYGSFYKPRVGLEYGDRELVFSLDHPDSLMLVQQGGELVIKPQAIVIFPDQTTIDFHPSPGSDPDIAERRKTLFLREGQATIEDTQPNEPLTQRTKNIYPMRERKEAIVTPSFPWDGRTASEWHVRIGTNRTSRLFHAAASEDISRGRLTAETVDFSDPSFQQRWHLHTAYEATEPAVQTKYLLEKKPHEYGQILQTLFSDSHFYGFMETVRTVLQERKQNTQGEYIPTGTIIPIPQEASQRLGLDEETTNFCRQNYQTLLDLFYPVVEFRVRSGEYKYFYDEHEERENALRERLGSAVVSFGWDAVAVDPDIAADQFSRFAVASTRANITATEERDAIHRARETNEVVDAPSEDTTSMLSLASLDRQHLIELLEQARQHVSREAVDAFLLRLVEDVPTEELIKRFGKGKKKLFEDIHTVQSFLRSQLAAEYPERIQAEAENIWEKLKDPQWLEDKLDQMPPRQREIFIIMRTHATGIKDSTLNAVKALEGFQQTSKEYLDRQTRRAISFAKGLEKRVIKGSTWDRERARIQALAANGQLADYGLDPKDLEIIQAFYLTPEKRPDQKDIEEHVGIGYSGISRRLSSIKNKLGI